jgi:L-fuculose-phosphate aldolase
MENIREAVLKTAVQAASYGLCRNRSGNFSYYDRNAGLVYITPSGVSREALTAEQIVVVDLNNNHISGEGKASSETPMHLEIYKARPDVNAIVHTHSCYATAFAVANKPIPPCIVEALFLGGQIEVGPFEFPGTLEFARRAVEALGDRNAVLLQNHGVTCVGKDLDEALLHALYVEDVAKIIFVAKHIGEVSPLPDSVIERFLNR